MPDSDPQNIRQAVAEFQPRRRPRFQNLLTCRDVVFELRDKGASSQAIAELLTRHGIKTSRTMVSEFLRSQSEPKAHRRRKPHLKMTTMPAQSAPAQTSVPPIRHPELSMTEPRPVRARGPHIAKVELLKPDQSHE
jgi:hypothetical protein